MSLAIICPAGIGIVVSGERWVDNSKLMIGNLDTFEEFFKRFGGSDCEVQGVYNLPRCYTACFNRGGLVTQTLTGKPAVTIGTGFNAHYKNLKRFLYVF